MLLHCAQCEIHLNIVLWFGRAVLRLVLDSRHFRRCLHFTPYRFAYDLHEKTIDVRANDSIVPVIAFALSSFASDSGGFVCVFLFIMILCRRFVYLLICIVTVVANLI